MSQKNQETGRAIPTTYNGITFKSRLEARFAEWLLTTNFIPFIYEPLSDKPRYCGHAEPLPPIFSSPPYQTYRPDFYLISFDIFIEIKPKEFCKEIELFWPEISGSDTKWIMVDQYDRTQWEVLCAHGLVHSSIQLFAPAFLEVCKLKDARFEFLIKPRALGLGKFGIYKYGPATEIKEEKPEA